MNGFVPVCEIMLNTLVILTMGYALVNDGNQVREVLIVLVNLSDKYYNELIGFMQ